MNTRDPMEAELLSAERTNEEWRLDAEVATRFMGFRWVEWSPGAEGPLREPGRFLAKRDSPLSHLHRPAGPEAPLHERPLSRVPRYAAAVGRAFEVVKVAGLFDDGRAVLHRDPEDGWVVEVRGLRLASPRLGELLCRASLAWADTAGKG